VEVGPVLVGDLGQRDRRDVQFLSLDEVEEEVQRALKDGELELELARFPFLRALLDSLPAAV